MSFTQVQIDALKAPLDFQHVKQREQSGRKLSYIEGWKAIDEANRIFGFDGWTRETVETRMVAERERKIGKAPNQRDGWGVSYVCRVRVVVCAEGMDIVREGIGSGHGIDVDCGLAHESAVKEAETDAMKRAMMTFGNPFGLALYDKTHANVETLPKKNARDIYARLQKEVDAKTDLHGLRTWGEDNRERIGVLPMDWQDILRARFHERLVTLRQHPTNAETAPHIDPEPDYDEDGVVWDDPPESGPDHSKWATLSPVKQAAIRCGEPAFWMWLSEVGHPCEDAVQAAVHVRLICNVKSRALLSTDDHAKAKWHHIDSTFTAWKHADTPSRASPPNSATQPATSPKDETTTGEVAGTLEQLNDEMLDMFRLGMHKAANIGEQAFRDAWKSIPKQYQRQLTALKDELKQKMKGAA